MDCLNSLRAALPLHSIAAGSAALLLAACGNAVDEDVPPNPADVDMPATDYERDEPPLAPPSIAESEDCNADLVEPFIGREADFRVRSEVLEYVAPIVNVRWLGPGEEGTREFEMVELIIRLDEDDTILSARCE
ncbi:MAG: hypothetical protein V2I27_08090 [Erythrobacter sp.]|jgi:hypothetical protein|nr:hypothetical protein [Erythrobacter sp.]